MLRRGRGSCALGSKGGISEDMQVECDTLGGIHWTSKGEVVLYKLQITKHRLSEIVKVLEVAEGCWSGDEGSLLFRRGRVASIGNRERMSQAICERV